MSIHHGATNPENEHRLIHGHDINTLPAPSTTEQAELETSREPQFQASGWNIVIQTDNGFVSLKNFSSEDQLFLEYDGDPLPPELIRKILELREPGENIKFSNTNGEQPKAQSIYTSDILPEGGKVWVITNEPHGEPSPNFIDAEGKLKRVCQTKGDQLQNNIGTYPFHLAEINNANGPNANPGVIQRYREKFVLLAAETAFQLGRPIAVTTEFDSKTILTPAILSLEEYSTRVVAGNLRLPHGGGEEVIEVKRGTERIILKSGNGSVPWISLRQIKVEPTINNSGDLAASILRTHLYF